MKIKETYICEKCGTEYQLKQFAELCESFAVPIPKYKIGEKVYYLDRNGEINNPTITNRKIIIDSFLSYFENSSSEEEFEKVKAQLDKNPHSYAYYFGGQSFYVPGKVYVEWLVEEALGRTEKEARNRL